MLLYTLPLRIGAVALVHALLCVAMICGMICAMHVTTVTELFATITCNIRIAALLAGGHTHTHSSCLLIAP